jgi:hypothetical protein
MAKWKVLTGKIMLVLFFGALFGLFVEEAGLLPTAKMIGACALVVGWLVGGVYLACGGK